MEQNLTEKTGKTLQQWFSILNKKSFSKHGEYMKLLKNEYGITHGYANFITLKFRKTGADSIKDEDLIANQYQGKNHLKIIYQLLNDEILKMANDIEVVPKKAAVSYRAKRQFALIQPTTKKRIDLGLKFNQMAHKGRLETSGPFGSMCTHRVQLTEVAQIDKELLQWIQQSYQEAK